jgi:hypothetical protein
LLERVTRSAGDRVDRNATLMSPLSIDVSTGSVSGVVVDRPSMAITAARATPNCVQMISGPPSDRLVPAIPFFGGVGTFRLDAPRPQARAGSRRGAESRPENRTGDRMSWQR